MAVAGGVWRRGRLAASGWRTSSQSPPLWRDRGSLCRSIISLCADGPRRGQSPWSRMCHRGGSRLGQGCATERAVALCADGPRRGQSPWSSLCLLIHGGTFCRWYTLPYMKHLKYADSLLLNYTKALQIRRHSPFKLYKSP